ncbi:hypothetical protein SCHPADRAFT_193206 [Schizopora paradoxa]|uniref:Uncharacterized protein n=1 Tax=Schizopora paradoxa TaxID=27342 RepID=A0A0H2S5S9_9AGAM|nr:hypothetical protein SCHPADRAFT_193206 [Schizopora paradoxa]
MARRCRKRALNTTTATATPAQLLLVVGGREGYVAFVHAGSSCWPKNCRIWLARTGGRCRAADHRKFKIFAFAAHAPISSTRPFNLVKLSVRLEAVAFVNRKRIGKNTKWDARDINILRGVPPIDDVDSISTLKRSPPLGAGCKRLVLTAAEMQVFGCRPCATLLSPSYRSQFLG